MTRHLAGIVSAGIIGGIAVTVASAAPSSAVNECDGKGYITHPTVAPFTDDWGSVGGVADACDRVYMATYSWVVGGNYYEVQTRDKTYPIPGLYYTTPVSYKGHVVSLWRGCARDLATANCASNLGPNMSGNIRTATIFK